MTPIEIMALIFAAAILIKLIVAYNNPKKLLKAQDKLTKDAQTWMIVIVVLAVIVGYYIFQVMSIVYVAAVMLFTSLLMGIAWFTDPKALMDTRKSVLKGGLSKYWISVVIWALLALWTLWALFV